MTEEKKSDLEDKIEEQIGLFAQSTLGQREEIRKEIESLASQYIMLTVLTNFGRIIVFMKLLLILLCPYI